MDQENQDGESRVTDSAQDGESRVTEQTAGAISETEKKPEAAISQSDWQQAQEQIRQLRQQQDDNALARFEAENAIVQTEKYKDRWQEALKKKRTPGHRYANLDLGELLNIIRDPSDSIVTETQRKPIIPSVKVTGGMSGGGDIDPQVNEWLSLRYSQQEIESTKR